MTSIHTNPCAASALATLRKGETSLKEASLRAATGLRIGSAKDNAAYWSVATTLRGDIATRQAAYDALNLSIGHVDTAHNGIANCIDLLNQMKDKFLLAADATDEQKLTIEQDVLALRKAMISATKSSSFADDNWLYKSSTAQSNTRSLVSSVTRNGDGSIGLQTVEIDLTELFLIDSSIANSSLGLLSRANSATSGYSAFAYTRHIYAQGGSGNVSVVATPGATATGAHNGVLACTRIIDIVLGELGNAAAMLGSVRNGLDLQKALCQKLDTVERRSLGVLVDADMNETSARLRAMQTRQLLAYQTLSIANASTGSILQLYR